MKTSIRKSISESQSTDINSINSSLKEKKYFYKEVIDLNVTMDQEFIFKTHIFGQNTEADKLEWYAQIITACVLILHQIAHIGLGIHYSAAGTEQMRTAGDWVFWCVATLASCFTV